MVGSDKYWLYVIVIKIFVVKNVVGVVVYFDIMYLILCVGIVNEWMGCVFGGILIFNSGEVKVLMFWNLDMVSKFVDMINWFVNIFCKVLCMFKNFLIVLNVMKVGVLYLYMIKWSYFVDFGVLFLLWDEID